MLKLGQTQSKSKHRQHRNIHHLATVQSECSSTWVIQGLVSWSPAHSALSHDFSSPLPLSQHSSQPPAPPQTHCPQSDLLTRPAHPLLYPHTQVLCVHQCPFLTQVFQLFLVSISIPKNTSSSNYRNLSTDPIVHYDFYLYDFKIYFPYLKCPSIPFVSTGKDLM